MGYFSVIFALSVVVLPSVLGWSALHLVSGEDIISRHESERGIEPDSSECVPSHAQKSLQDVCPHP